MSIEKEICGLAVKPVCALLTGQMLQLLYQGPNQASQSCICTSRLYPRIKKEVFIPADKVASPVEAMSAVHPNQALLCSLNCPMVDFLTNLCLDNLLSWKASLKIPVELVNNPLTGHHPPLSENFHMFHPSTLQLLRRIIPEQEG